ncbi:hypothetical protein [Leptospira interrogans]|uniref:hypothetical protein n=1 Tax=Leptospira interrogans TaxID=173 RepID=UPI0007734C72|nr:hypothetical protein [Leptospira interrogans]
MFFNRGTRHVSQRGIHLNTRFTNGLGNLSTTIHAISIDPNVGYKVKNIKINPLQSQIQFPLQGLSSGTEYYSAIRFYLTNSLDLNYILNFPGLGYASYQFNAAVNPPNPRLSTTDVVDSSVPYGNYNFLELINYNFGGLGMQRITTATVYESPLNHLANSFIGATGSAINQWTYSPNTDQPSDFYFYTGTYNFLLFSVFSNPGQISAADITSYTLKYVANFDLYPGGE